MRNNKIGIFGETAERRGHWQQQQRGADGTAEGNRVASGRARPGEPKRFGVKKRERGREKVHPPGAARYESEISSSAVLTLSSHGYQRRALSRLPRGAETIRPATIFREIPRSRRRTALAFSPAASHTSLHRRSASSSVFRRWVPPLQRSRRFHRVSKVRRASRQRPAAENKETSEGDIRRRVYTSLE